MARRWRGWWVGWGGVGWGGWGRGCKERSGGAYPMVRMKSIRRSKGTAHELVAKLIWWLISKSSP